MKYQVNYSQFHKGRYSKSKRNRTLGQKVIRNKLHKEMIKIIEDI